MQIDQRHKVTGRAPKTAAVLNTDGKMWIGEQLTKIVMNFKDHCR